MEIEQKFLVKKIPENLDSYDVKVIRQGYISCEPVLRIRKSNSRYIFTFKSRGTSYDKNGICVANEFEADLSEKEYNILSKKCVGSIISKKRYTIPLDERITGVSNLKAELDIFEGMLKGLVFVEVEFENITDCEKFIKPEWFGVNVSDDIRYKNNYLSTITSRERFKELFN